jgi:hypothetical protein
MPRGDRTGPEGYGPRTGRGMGYCSGSNAPEYFGDSYNRGIGFGHGYGRGSGRGVDFGRRGGSGRGGIFLIDQASDIETRDPSSEEEKEYLENLVSSMEKEISDIRNRLEELNKE